MRYRPLQVLTFFCGTQARRRLSELKEAHHDGGDPNERLYRRRARGPGIDRMRGGAGAVPRCPLLSRAGSRRRDLLGAGISSSPLSPPSPALALTARRRRMTAHTACALPSRWPATRYRKFFAVMSVNVIFDDEPIDEARRQAAVREVACITPGGGIRLRRGTTPNLGCAATGTKSRTHYAPGPIMSVRSCYRGAR